MSPSRWLRLGLSSGFLILAACSSIPIVPNDNNKNYKNNHNNKRQILPDQLQCVSNSDLDREDRIAWAWLKERVNRLSFTTYLHNLVSSHYLLDKLVETDGCAMGRWTLELLGSELAFVNSSLSAQVAWNDAFGLSGTLKGPLTMLFRPHVGQPLFEALFLQQPEQEQEQEQQQQQQQEQQQQDQQQQQQQLLVLGSTGTSWATFGAAHWATFRLIDRFAAWFLKYLLEIGMPMPAPPIGATGTTRWGKQMLQALLPRARGESARLNVEWSRKCRRSRTLHSRKCALLLAATRLLGHIVGV
ncbi:unnamed protein product [Polarella glacialis]|uniref:Phospholipase B-like n=1 Tax=Polarella glacialis TaxID=89957 RepID=A0A813LKY1_POLGL|nr:unnamed protein product [Polarella glacialis]